MNDNAILLGMETLFDKFRALRSKNEAARTQRMAAFLQQYQDYVGSMHSTMQFNLLDVAGVGHNEVRHSSLLAWLLNPKSLHACGTMFLQSFLRAATISIPEEDLGECYVRTEFSGIESRIDIVIYIPGRFLVYVENKIYAGESEDQVDREFRDMHRLAHALRVPREQAYPVFLTPDGRLPVSGDAAPWFSLSYPSLASEFASLQASLTEPKIAFLIEDLIEHYNRWSRI